MFNVTLAFKCELTVKNLTDVILSCIQADVYQQQGQF